MSAVDEILRELPLDQLAAQLGTDEHTAKQAVEQAVPLLMTGMQNNAEDPQGEQALAGALSEHAQRDLLSGGLDLDQIDTTDGEKIVRHIFGSDQAALARLAGTRQAAGQSSLEPLIRKLLPILAPIVLAWIAQKLQGGRTQSGAQGGDILGQILNGMLGGGQQAPQQRTSPQTSDAGAGSILGPILGGLLGGGDLGSILGGLTGTQAPQQQSAPQAPAPQQQAFPTQPADDGGIGIEEPQSNDSGTGAQEQHSGGGIMDVLKGMLGGK